MFILGGHVGDCGTLTRCPNSIDSLRLLSQPGSDIAKVAQITLNFERKALSEANDKVSHPSLPTFWKKRREKKKTY